MICILLIFRFFITIRSYTLNFSHGKASSTEIDDVTNKVTRRIFDANWQYSNFSLKVDFKIWHDVFSIRFNDNSKVAYF